MVLCASSAVMPALKQALTCIMFPFYPIKKCPLLNTCIAFPLMMTHVRACLWDAARELEIHISQRRISASHAPPSWFSRGRTHTQREERKNVHSGTLLEYGCHYLLQQLGENCTSLSLDSAPIPAPLPPHHERNVSIIHKWCWFAHKRFFVPRKFWFHLEGIYWWHSLDILLQ